MPIVTDSSAVRKPWRWRQCPACRTVLPAGQFVWTWTDDYWEQPWTNGRHERMCPACCHQGRTADFAVVRERHPEQRSAPPPQPVVRVVEEPETLPVQGGLVLLEVGR